MKRRIRDSFILGASLAALLALAGCGSETPTAKTGAATGTPTKFNLLVGTYTEGPASSGKSKGIPVFRFDTTSGEAVHLADNDGIRNPSWLVVTPSGGRVYAVNELNGTGKSGEVSAFEFVPATGKLGFINKVSSEGDDPCHLLWDQQGSESWKRGNEFGTHFGNCFAGLPGPLPAMLYVSNYSSGGMVPLTVELNGRLKPSSESTNDDPRVPAQADSHIHSVVQPHTSRGYLTQDLGTDTIHIMFRPHDAIYTYNRTLTLPKGTGPRHLIFDTKNKHAYVIGELNDSVTMMDYRDLNLYPHRPVTLGAPIAPGKGTAAAIHLSDDGRFLYASTRNPKNILVVFAVSPADGTLREIQTVPSGGLAPREFAIAPGGKFLLVANQQSDAIAVFSRDPETGKITDTGRRIPVGSPTDLKWAPAK